MGIDKVLGGLFVACGLIGGSFVLRDAARLFIVRDESIEVRGFAERMVRSDEGIWSVSYLVSSETLPDLHRGVASTQQSLRTFFEREGFSPAEIQFPSVRTNDTQADGSYQSGGKPAPRYSARGVALVSSSKVDALIGASTRTQSLLAEGVVVEGSDVRFFFTGLQAIKPEMLTEATRNAEEAATTLARDAGVSRGRLRTVSQGLFSITAPQSDNEYEAAQSLMKRVRVVTRATYQLDAP